MNLCLRMRLLNVEIEAKMRLVDTAAMEQKLKSLGGVFEAEVFETNTYFDTDQRQLKSADRGLRIRVEKQADGGCAVRITHKGPRAHGRLKSRSETEVTVTDADDAAALLRALGYVPVLTFEKRRRRWELGGCEVELDELPHLGSFIEIEGSSDEAVLAVREKLGLAETPLVRASYIAMLMSYLHEHELQANTVRFADEVKSER